MSADLAALKTELLALDRQLRRAALHAGDDAAPSQSGQMAILKQRLDDRLADFDGSAWQLLLLEWRYDFVLLFDQVRLWMDYIDADFSTGSAPKAWR